MGLSESTVQKHIAKGMVMCAEYLEAHQAATEVTRACAPAQPHAATEGAMSDPSNKTQSTTPSRGKVVRLHGSRELREEASGWIVGLEEGLSEQQMSELKAWLAADAAHRKAFLAMAEQWDTFDSL